jgi:hypothetical protein
MALQKHLQRSLRITESRVIRFPIVESFQESSELQSVGELKRTK